PELNPSHPTLFPPPPLFRSTLAGAPRRVAAERSAGPDATSVTISLHNPTRHIAFFERAEATSTRDGDEILPIGYSDNYVTVYPGETVRITGRIAASQPAANWIRVSGYNSAPVVVPIDPPARR
ncbi:hypothetical protein ACWDTP_34195, partial [Mycobacterium sp. NPDC003449]